MVKFLDIPSRNCGGIPVQASLQSSPQPGGMQPCRLQEAWPLPARLDSRLHGLPVAPKLSPPAGRDMGVTPSQGTLGSSKAEYLSKYCWD